MADRNPARALSVVGRVEMMCDFIEHPEIKTAVEQAVPVPMPRAPGALGFDIPLWVGLGTVGLWAALDGFSVKASRSWRTSVISTPTIMQARPTTSIFAIPPVTSLSDVRVQLTCGATFDGRRLCLDLPHLREYSRTRVLQRFA